MDNHTIDLPQTASEADAFVAAVTSMPEMHAHGGNSGMAREHMRMLELVDRGEATHVAVAPGDWFDPATWHEGRIPGADANVLIPHGVEVTYDGTSNASLNTVRVDGELAFATDTDTRMVVDTFVVAPTGRLEIGTAETPVEANVQAEIVIANNGDIDVSWDPMLQSRGVISHGEVEIHGAEKTSFLKVDTAPMAGDRQIRLEEVPEGWQVGDTLVLTGTHKQGWGWDNDLRRVVHRDSEDEEVTITGINGNRITIDRPLEHDHDTPRDDLDAYVTNMTRNITISSEDGAATEVHHRGHVMFMHSDAVDVRYAAFDDLGRTDKSFAAADASRFSSIDADSNVKGRYAVHLHKTGTEDQDDPAFLVGNAVSGSPGWGIAHHSSHAVIVDNAVFGAFGAAFAAEDGDETGVWARNIAINSEGFAWGESSAKLQSDVLRHDNGRTGDGFFFAGRLVESAENVAANTTHGFVWMTRSSPSDPLSANLDHPEIAYGTETMRHDQAPIQGFRDNEAFGTEVGLIVVKGDSRQEHDVRTVMDGFLNWETANGVDLSYTSHYTFSDIDLIGAEDSYSEFGYRLGGNAYDMVVNGMEIEGFERGVDLTRNNFSFPATNSDIDQVFIDVSLSDVGTRYAGFNPAQDTIMNSDDLVEGRLRFAMTGDLSIAPGQTLFFNGTKTDSIGSRDRQFTSVDDIQRLSFQENIVPMLRDQGYYTTAGGDHVLLIEDLVADRATGELIKFAHRVTLEMSEAQLANLGAIDNGRITLGGPAPIGRPDTATVASGDAVIIDVLDNDSDNGQIRVDGFTQPQQGGVLMGPNGTLIYIAGINTQGTDTFSYWVADNSGNFTPTQVTVTIDPDGSPTPPPPTEPGNETPTTGGSGSWSGFDNSAVLNPFSISPPTMADVSGGNNGRAGMSIDGTGGSNEIEGGQYNDTIRLLGGDDRVWGRDGNDRLEGGTGADTLGGEDGNDTMLGDSGADKLWSGSGNDWVSGGDGNDTATGSLGNDVVDGGNGQDRIWGGRGDDILSGGNGADTIGTGYGSDSVLGGDGNDRIYGSYGADLLNGGADNDTIFGGNHDDTIAGAQGNDALNGGSGDDILLGNVGDDTLTGGFGQDTLIGGQGSDTFIFTQGHGRDRIFGFDTDEDRIRIQSENSFGDLTIRDTGSGGTLVQFSNGQVVLEDVAPADLSASDFLFG